MKTINQSELATAKKLLQASKTRSLAGSVVPVIPNQYNVVLHLGDTPADSAVTLPNGSSITGIVSASLSLDPETNMTFLNLKIANPKVLAA